MAQHKVERGDRHKAEIDDNARKQALEDLFPAAMPARRCAPVRAPAPDTCSSQQADKNHPDFHGQTSAIAIAAS